MLRASDYVDMALLVGSDIDLGSASADELAELFADAVSMGFGYEIGEA